jgi:outer membrane protein TolC
MTGLLHHARRCAGYALLVSLGTAGCTAAGGRAVVEPSLASSQAVQLGSHANGGPTSNGLEAAASSQRTVAVNPNGGVVPAGYESVPCPPDPIAACDDPFAGQTELTADVLVAAVLQRNPSLAAMVSAWQAAAERYPQVISLEDPMLSLALGPGTFGDPTHDVAWMVQGSQKIPWCGKRELRGQQARAEASAARMDVDDAELRLAETAKLALVDYAFARRDLALNAENLKLAQGFHDDAESRYRNNLVTQQDVLQAELEIDELRRRTFELKRMEQVAIARINTLVHLPADHRLPPPGKLSDIGALPSLGTLQQLAIDRRPDLMALGARLQAEQTAVELAEREYYPDLNVVGRYDAFWQHADRQLAPMVGIDMNVPLDNERRRAAIREAQHRVDERRADYEAKVDEIHGEVQAAYEEVVESRRTVELFRQTISPAAQQNFDSALANYKTGRVDFLRLIDANRQLIALGEQNERALADLHQHLAGLERAAGGPLPETAVEPLPPGRSER